MQRDINKALRIAPLASWRNSLAMSRGILAVVVVVLAGFAAARKWFSATRITASTRV